MKIHLIILCMLVFTSCSLFDKEEETKPEVATHYDLHDPLKMDLDIDPSTLSINRNLAKTWNLQYYITHHIMEDPFATFGEGYKYVSGIYGEKNYTLKLNADSTYIKTLEMNNRSIVTTTGKWKVRKLYFSLQDNDATLAPEDFVIQYTLGESPTLKMDRDMELPTKDLSTPGHVFLEWPQKVLHVFSE